MICPQCGESNSENFRFCGMCGGSLAAQQPAAAPKIANSHEPTRTLVASNHIVGSPSPVTRQVPPISGPSMLGLNLRDANQPGPTPADPISPQHAPANVPPQMDSLRQTPFSGLESYLESEPPKSRGQRLLLLLVLLAALGGATWWAYGYLDVAKVLRSESASNTGAPRPTSPVSDTPSGNPPASPAAQDAAPPAASAVPETPAQNPTASPEVSSKAAKSAPEPATPPAEVVPSLGRSTKPAEKPKQPTTAARHPKLPEPSTADGGSADFRRGEAYLYGRSVPENCDAAMKYLKAASAKNSAKARSTFGTMYATGHCVPHDLPTSYLWFAMALRADPNNQILEKDLSAVWNQMTPPERQLATRMKQ